MGGTHTRHHPFTLLGLMTLINGGINDPAAQPRAEISPRRGAGGRGGGGGGSCPRGRVKLNWVARFTPKRRLALMLPPTPSPTPEQGPLTPGFRWVSALGSPCVFVCVCVPPGPPFSHIPFFPGEVNVGGIVAAVVVLLMVLGLAAFGVWFAYSRGFFSSE